MRFYQRLENQPRRKGKRVDVVPTGIVTDTPGEYDKDGNEITPPTYKNGFYVVAVEPVEDWEQFKSDEPLPVIYAGRRESSTLYVFPTKEAFENAFEAGKPEPPQELPEAPELPKTPTVPNRPEIPT